MGNSNRPSKRRIKSDPRGTNPFDHSSTITSPLPTDTSTQDTITASSFTISRAIQFEGVLTVETVDETLSTAKKLINSGKESKIRKALHLLYEERNKVKAALKQTPMDDPDYNSIVLLDKQIQGMIDHQVDRLMDQGPPELDPDSILVGHRLGEGSYGNVFKGLLHGQEVAIKIPFIQADKEGFDRNAFIQEVTLMRKLFHPNIVLLLGACTRGKDLLIVTELLSQDLGHFLKESNRYVKTTFIERIKMAKDVAKGLSWLHSHNIIHRDLKAGNVLMDEHKTCKVADFGFGAIKKSPEEKLQDTVSAKGNLLYMSPEVMQFQPFDESSDVYSFGFILWEIIVGQNWRPPAKFARDHRQYKKFVCEMEGRPPLDAKIKIDPIQDPRHPKTIPPALQDLLSSLWSSNPKERPSLQHTIYRLNCAMIDYHLNYKEARDFWKKYFLSEKSSVFAERVSFRTLVKALRAQFSRAIPYRDPHGLYALLCWDWSLSEPEESAVKKDSKVELERFGEVSNALWKILVESNIEDTCQELRRWTKHPAFHGVIDRNVTKGRIGGREPGTYLIRLSSTVATKPLTVTYVDGKGDATTTKNIRIQVGLEKKVGNVTYRLEGKQEVYNSLEELISKATYNFTTPCPKKDASLNYVL